MRRRKPPGATTRGGWGNHHQRRRAAIAPLVNAGKATCARCHEPIHAGEEWHLDHNDTRDGYLGVSHATCNLRDGASKTTHGAAQTPLFSSPTDGHNGGATNLRSARSTSTADAPRNPHRQRRMAAARRHLRRRVDLTPRRSPSGTGRYVGPLRMDDRKVEVNDDPRAASVRPNSISRLSLRTEAATSLRGFCVPLG